MIRRLVKDVYARVVLRTHAGRLLGVAPDRRRFPFIVCYHRVVEDARAGAPASLPAMLVTRKTLERQLDWLASRFEMIDLDEVGERVLGKRRGSRPAAAVTFDDGYRDVGDLAVPLLARKGIPAAIFVVTDHVGSKALLMHDRLYLLVARLGVERPSGRSRLTAALEDAGVRWRPAPTHDAVALCEAALGALDAAALRRLAAALEREVGLPEKAARDHALLDWPALVALADAGFTIGSHTRTHAWMGRENTGTVLRELLGSRLELSAQLGREARHLAFPAGSFDTTAVHIAHAAGYRFGYACCAHGDPHHPQLTIPRRVFWENTTRDRQGSFSPALMLCQAQSVLGFGVRCAGHGGHRARPDVDVDTDVDIEVAATVERAPAARYAGR